MIIIVTFKTKVVGNFQFAKHLQKERTYLSIYLNRKKKI